MRTALVVDDSSMMRSILRRTLEFAGFQTEAIREASNGQEALESIASSRPDIVLCDVNMPVLDGFGVLQALALKGVLEELPVLMVTSRTSLSTVKRLLDLGAREVVAKPFEAQRLHERIQAYLPPEPRLSELGGDMEGALVRAGLSTLEKLLFVFGEQAEPTPAAAPHIVAELDVTHPEGVLLLAGVPETLTAVHPEHAEGVAPAAEALAELLNVLVGAFRAELDVQEGSFGLPRTRLAGPEDFALQGGVAISVGDVPPLRIGFQRAGEGAEPAAPGAGWNAPPSGPTADADGWAVPPDGPTADAGGWVVPPADEPVGEA
jgi:two-component system chemotaxis response regulator CheY